MSVPPVLGPTMRVPVVVPPKPRAARATSVGHWLRDTGLGITGFLVVLVVAVAGWTASFIGLHDFGDRKMGLSGGEAWLVPITFDGAALGLSLVVFRASIHGRGASMWRLLIVVFTLLSAWINWQHITDDTGRWIASFMPPSAVVLFEGLMSEARAAASRRLGRERPRLHPLRWVIDRQGTWAMYRAYVLGIEVPEHLKTAPPAVAVGQQKPAKSAATGGQELGQDIGQDIGQDGAPERTGTDGPGRQEQPPSSGQQQRPTGRQKSAARPANKPARSAAKSAAKKRRSMDEWVDIGTPVFHAEFKRLRRPPSGTEFAKALGVAGYGKPSASTAKNIRAEILDRMPLPQLEDQ